MVRRTLIEWTDASWNPTVGCSVKSPGCDNCYASGSPCVRTEAEVVRRPRVHSRAEEALSHN